MSGHHNGEAEGNVYARHPLRKNSSDIRLLLIHPADSPNDPLTCDLQVASLDDNDVEYAAISYTWGDHVPDHTILLDGFDFAITKHLHSALKVFRMASGPIFWIDQICIDQCNLSERSGQVALMTRIYRQPDSVLVWLGEATEDTDPALHFLHGLLSLNAPWQVLDPSGHTEQWNGLFDILARPWHSRAWIIQETTSCERIQVFCGRGQMPFNALEALLRLLQKRWIDSTSFISAQTLEVKRNMENLDKLFQTRRRHLKRLTPCSPLRVFDSFRDFQASDNRDKVYSLMWLIPDRSGIPKPDYSLPTETVYQDYARYFISSGLGLQLLTVAGKHQTRLKVPSWCPDWTCVPKVRRFASTSTESADHSKSNPKFSFENIEHLKALGMIQILRTFSASGDWSSPVNVGPDPSQLSIKGVLVDTVVQLGGPSSQRAGTMHEWWSAWMTASLNIIHKTAAIRYSETPTSRLDALSRLVTADDALHIHKGSGVLSAFESSIRDGSTSIEDFRVPIEHLRAIRLFDKDFQVPQVLLTAFCFVVPEMVQGRRLCVREKGFIGLVPDIVETGDIVSIILGVTAPSILRRDSNSNSYALIGDAFILDMMQGEALKKDNLVAQDIFVI